MAIETYEEVLEYLRSGGVQVENLVEMRDAINEVVPVEEEELPYWDLGISTEIWLGEERIELLQRGRAQLDQIGKLRDWLGIWARPLLEGAGKSKKDDDAEKVGIDMILQLLDPEALLELGCVLIMRDEPFVEEHFDIGWVLDVAGKIIKHQPAIRRLTQGFFGRLGS